MLEPPQNHHCNLFILIPTWLRRYLSSLHNHFTLEAALLSDFLLPSHSAGYLHQWLAMAWGKQDTKLRGSSGSSLESPPQAWLSIGSSLKWASKSFQTGSASLPTAALKPTDLPLPSALMPSGHRSPQDLGDDLALCVSMNQERITSYSCALDNWPYTQAPTLHCFTMDQVFLSVTDWWWTKATSCEPETSFKLQTR